MELPEDLEESKEEEEEKFNLLNAMEHTSASQKHDKNSEKSVKEKEGWKASSNALVLVVGKSESNNQLAESHEDKQSHQIGSNNKRQI